LKSIEIITHCYAEKRPEFASLLTAQLSSLALWRPRCDVQVSVCSSPDDVLSHEVCVAFCNIPRPRASIVWHPFQRQDLYRRSIGRNHCAKMSGADIVWHCDCDYIFGQGCLEALAASNFKGLAFPREAFIHRSHADGDREIARIKPGELFKPDMTLFQPWSVKFAIGGLQIVDGDTARSKGYLDGTRWVKPVPTATDFINTREDRVFRGQFPKSTPLSLPNLYRMRHSCSSFESPESRLKQTSG
jgi:hypothetical protein